MSRHDEPTNNVPLSGAEIAGFMNWRGPGAYTAHAERRIVRLIAEAVRCEWCGLWHVGTRMKGRKG